MEAAKEKGRNMYAIGIDIGTTSICGVLIDITDGRILKQKTVPYEAFIRTGNSWEKIQDAEKLISIATGILDKLLVPDTLVIGLTGQMHGILYFNREGKAVSPLYTWQDGRGNLFYKETTYAQYLDSCTGYGNVTDFYNRENGIRPKEAVSYCTIQDYLAMTLCGLKRPVIHTSNAASFGCYDLRTNEFSYETDIEISGNFELAGEYKGVPVGIAIGDNQAGVFSTLADENRLLVNVGTGSQVTIVSPQIIEGSNIESRPYFEGKYLVVGAALCGGRAYSLLKDFYTKIIQAAGGDTSDVYGLMERMITEKHSSSLKVDTRFDGTRKEPEICGSIMGLRTENFTPEELTYGILEGMAGELFDMYGQMRVKRCGMVGSGNGIRQNKKLIQIIEKCFKDRLSIPVHREEAAYGAALFGLAACGKFENAAEAQKLIRYEPDAENT